MPLLLPLASLDHLSLAADMQFVLPQEIPDGRHGEPDAQRVDLQFSVWRLVGEYYQRVLLQWEE